MKDESQIVIKAQARHEKTRTGSQKAFRNFGFLMTGKILGDIFTFLLFVTLSRTFGREGIGQYSFAISLTGFFAVFADFGLYSYSIKELSRHIDSFGESYSRIFSLRVILSVVTYGLLLLVLIFLPFSRENKLVIILIGAYQVMSRLVEGIAAIFIAREDTHLAGILDASHKAMTASSGIAVIIAGGSLVVTLAALPALTAGQLFIAYRLIIKKYGRPRLVASWSSLMDTAREAIPYALSIILFQFYSRIGIIILGLLLGSATTGIFSAAYRVVFLLMFIPQFAAFALLPVASRLFIDSRKKLEKLYHNSLNVFILIGLPAVAGLWLIAPDLLLIFGDAFAESAPVLRLLTGLLFLNGLNRLLGVFLIACDRQAERPKIQWKAAWVNLAGNLILITLFGVKGAAVAALISEALLTILFMLQLKKILGWPQVGSRLAMSSVAVSSFCFPFTLFPSLSVFAVVPASALLYSVTLILFKEIRKKEARMVISLVNGWLK